MSDANPAFEPPPPPPLPPPSARRMTSIRIPGIILIVLALVCVGLGVAKVLPGGVGTGLLMGLTGIVFIALSFVVLPDVPPDQPLSTGEKLAGIFYEPTRVFRSLRSNPTWVAPILIIGILNAAYLTAFTHRLTPERIVNYTVDKMADTPFIPPE